MVFITFRNRCYLVSALIVSLISLAAFAVNHYFFQFPGNDYFPAWAWIPGIYLFCAWLLIGMALDFDHYFVQVVQNIALLYCTFALIAILTTAIQYTPFYPIDGLLIVWEQKLGINMAGIVQWTAQHPGFKFLLISSYDSIALQMSILPFALCFFGFTDKLREYYCLMLISAIIGFLFYYFFPTTAPASQIISPHFSAEQLDTGLKFRQIHSHIQPTTLEGGMIALPSFHVIWAWLCVYLARVWRPLLFLFVPLNILLALSCVLLGWHYPVDLFGSFIVIVLTHIIYLSMKNKAERNIHKILAGTPFGR